MRLGPFSGATVIVRNLDQALVAYVGQLGLVLGERDRLPRQRALDMGDAALAEAPRATLRSAADTDPWLTLIEMPAAPLATPFARRGWLAVSVLVSDIDALATRLDRHCWRVIGEPSGPSDGMRTLTLVGADGEVLQLTAATQPAESVRLPVARCPVDHICGAVLAARDGASALGFYEGLGLVDRWRRTSALPAWASAPGQEPGLEHSRVLGQLRGSHFIAIHPLSWLPAADSTLRTGIRMLSFERSDARGRRLAAHDDPSARILAGPEGEAIELV